MYATCPAYHKQTCSSSDLSDYNVDYLFVSLYDVLKYTFSNQFSCSSYRIYKPNLIYFFGSHS